MSCYINWTLSVAHINKSTLSITYSSTDSVEKLVPRVDKCLILCKGQSSLTKENREVDKIPSSANKRLWRKSYKKE